jgi:hypothetical protein
LGRRRWVYTAQNQVESPGLFFIRRMCGGQPEPHFYPQAGATSKVWVPKEPWTKN